MIIDRIFTPGLAQVAYLIADESSGDVAVIDPRHFVVPFNSDAFQCLARDCFETRTIRPMKEALIEVTRELKRRDDLDYPAWIGWESSRNTTTR
ncbi:MAG TPA: hypothetical protein VEQ36_12845 [Thermomicrobiales bacterium]|nr:hypothetical protein [Thermomicrobiales bacterium]